MDIGFYISELLEKKGEINVPGLGRFVHAYVPGYYHDAEGKFYPPTHRTQFDTQQSDDDDTLTQYIADTRNISLASSKYFTEKYIAELKEEALVKEVPLGNIGSFYTEYGKLLFKPTDGASGSSAFFGYPPVNLTRLGQEARAFQAPQTAPPPAPPVVNTPEPFYTSESNAPVFQSKPSIEEEEELYAEAEAKRPYGWIILLFIIIFAALAVFGVHRYYPERFARAKAWVQSITGSKKVEKPVVKKPEAVAVIPPKVDSAAMDSIKKQKTADSIAAATQAKKDAIKLKKQKIADSIAAAAQAKIQAKADAKIKRQKTADSIASARQAKKEAIKIKKQKTADSLAAATQAKKDAIKTKAAAANQSKTTATASTQVKQSSIPVPLGQVVRQSVAGAQASNTSFDYSKPWAAIVMVCANQAQADVMIVKLKKVGIDAFVVPNTRNSSILVAGATFKTNDEAQTAVNTYKSKGLSAAYIFQIVPKR